MTTLSIKLNTILSEAASLSEGDRAKLCESLEKLYMDHLPLQESSLYTELNSIRIKIANTKKEISAASATGAVTDAKEALAEVMNSTEKATDTILDAAEHIQKIANASVPGEAGQALSQQAIQIMEACNFQDLTGQLLQKVTVTVQFVEEVIGHVLEKIDIENDHLSEDETLMNGPALNGGATSQTDIDKLFD
jgi:chemotaxis protein CheZ